MMAPRVAQMWRFAHLALKVVAHNDPNGEHDFGSIVHQGKQVFWKIDCYAPDMEHGSEDPSDPAKTVRVL